MHRDDFPIAIIGTGFSGLAMAILLKQAGFHDLTLFEKGGDVGGTWRENTYPGAACDIPSHLYSFSFELNPAWTRAYSPQPEIQDYLRHCARKYDVLRHVRFHAEVTSAAFDEGSGTWGVRTRDGREVRARALVLGNGALHVPALPDIPGLDTFAGACFHSARWDHSCDFSGKRVAVIGTGASAVQFVPQIAPQAARLHLYQRSPPWVLPRPDRAYGDLERRAFARVPGWMRLYRALLYWGQEAMGVGLIGAPRLMRLAERLALRYLRQSVPDPLLREKLTPSYRMGCKRILLSSDYYPALRLPQVEVITDAIERVTPRGVRTRDGTEREADALVLGTGFSATRYLSGIAIRGAGGRDLDAVWQGTPQAYLGVTVSGFPNLYLLYGPNTTLGHNSMVFMIEAQARYALGCIQLLRGRRLRALDVRPDVQAAYNQALQARLRRSVWASGCRSWYLTPEGHNPTLWPGYTVEYWRRTRRVALADYAMAP